MKRKHAAAMADVAVAESKCLRSADVGREFDVDRRDVRQSKCTVAGSILQRQLELLDGWLETIRGNRRDSSVSCHFVLGHDTAKATFTSDLSTEMGDLAMKSPEHLLVSFLTGTLVFAEFSINLKLITPVIQIMDNSSGGLFVGLFQHLYMAKLHQRLRCFLQECPKGTLHIAQDGAASNEKLFAYLESENKDTPMFRTLCLNHRLHLCESVVRDMLGKDLISGLFALAHATRMGSFWFRMVAALHRTIDANTDIFVGPPPIQATLFNDEFFRLQSEFLPTVS